jgi:SAM-dependent methyltransferase
MRLTDGISLRSRRRKLRLFLDELQPTPETTVVDVGADDVGFGEAGGQVGCGTHNFFEQLYPWPERITAVGLHDGAALRRAHPAVAYVQADACALPFRDGEFDVYFSNAVIEHVGDSDKQRAFVAEALRVAHRVFVTTPNKWFPIEVHTRLPLVHWLPERAAHRTYELTRMPWAKDNHLLGPAELKALFPVPVRIVNLGMTLVAIT